MVGRAPKNHRPGTSRTRGKELYKKALQKLQRKHSRQSSKDKEQRWRSNSAHADRKSHKILEAKKTANFGAIFERLDSDSDGLISAFKIDISTLDEKQLGVLTPLLIEMESMGMTLDRAEFVDAAKRLYAAVPLPDKAVLVGTTKAKKAEEPKLSFKPQLCKKSLRIADRLRTSGDVAERTHQKRAQYDRRLEKMMEDRGAREMLGCTFQPRVLLGVEGDSNHSSAAKGAGADSRNRYATANHYIA